MAGLVPGARALRSSRRNPWRGRDDARPCRCRRGERPRGLADVDPAEGDGAGDDGGAGERDAEHRRHLEQPDRREDLGRRHRVGPVGPRGGVGLRVGADHGPRRWPRRHPGAVTEVTAPRTLSKLSPRLFAISHQMERMRLPRASPVAPTLTLPALRAGSLPLPPKRGRGALIGPSPTKWEREGPMAKPWEGEGGEAMGG